MSMKEVIEIIDKYERKPDKLLLILLELQKNSGRNYISEEWAEIVAKELNLPLSRVHDVITFYSMLSSKPRGKYIIQVCKSASCHVRGAENILEIFEEVLGIKVGETTEDGLFTLEATSCIGVCDISPAVKINDDVYGNLTREKVIEIVECYRKGGLKCQKQ